MSSISIKCRCIDDKGKPSEIPSSKWVKKNQEYTITHIFIMVQQNRIQGCELAEFDISMHVPYNCYRLSRFAFAKEDLDKVLQLMKDCNDLNQLEDQDIKKWVEELPLKTELV